MPPMNIREGIIIPSWPGLGVRVKEPIANSTSTKIAKAGMRLRAKMRGADQITVLDRGRDRESIHCIGSFCSCRKRELARTDNTIIVRALLQRLAAVRGRLSLCADQAAAAKRSEERRVGKEGVRPCRSRWWTDH